MFEVKIEKLTDVDLLRKAASMTTGKDSKISLKRAYALGHSLMRTQLFWVELWQIPLSVASHLVRHVHAQPYQLSKRPDRGGEDMEQECDELVAKIGKAYDEINKSYCDDPPYTEIYAALDSSKGFLSTASERFGRKSPTDLGLLLNAEEIVNISRVRLCAKASKETRDVWRAVVLALRDCDPELYLFCVPACIHQGFCREHPTCGICATATARTARDNYLKLFEQ